MSRTLVNVVRLVAPDEDVHHPRAPTLCPAISAMSSSADVELLLDGQDGVVVVGRREVELEDELLLHAARR